MLHGLSPACYTRPMLPFSALSTLPLLEQVPPMLLLTLIVLLAVWTTVIKAFALWHAARNNQLAWFIPLLVLNTLGILELVYLLAFRKDKQSYKVASQASAA